MIRKLTTLAISLLAGISLANWTVYAPNDVVYAPNYVISSGASTYGYTGSPTITTYTENGTNFTAYAFTSGGTFSVSNVTAYVDVLVVGSGGGGCSGGGGAGGYVFSNQMAVTAGTYTVTVGLGGNHGQPNSYSATNGTNSAFGTIIAYGGGAGANINTAKGNDGASGGGDGCSAGTQGVGGTNLWGTAQGYPGGGNLKGVGTYPCGGGGGAFSRGGDPANNATAGNGGSGKTNTMSGVATGYAGGGGGANYLTGGTNGTVNCGGGLGSSSGTGGNATANTGGGGGGAYATGHIGGNGGSGIVIIRHH
jgi:hypothetical protein